MTDYEPFNMSPVFEELHKSGFILDTLDVGSGGGRSRPWQLNYKKVTTIGKMTLQLTSKTNNTWANGITVEMAGGCSHFLKRVDKTEEAIEYIRKTTKTLIDVLEKEQREVLAETIRLAVLNKND
jgi:hypothetical protein